jgi:hypothetical protein
MQDVIAKLQYEHEQGVLDFSTEEQWEFFLQNCGDALELVIEEKGIDRHSVLYMHDKFITFEYLEHTMSMGSVDYILAIWLEPESTEIEYITEKDMIDYIRQSDYIFNVCKSNYGYN